MKTIEKYDKFELSMPDETGLWNYHILLGDLSLEGEFECVEPTADNHCPVFINLNLPAAGKYCVEIIDIWEMTHTIAADYVNNQVKIDLPGKDGIAVLITSREGKMEN